MAESVHGIIVKDELTGTVLSDIVSQATAQRTYTLPDEDCKILPSSRNFSNKHLKKVPLTFDDGYLDNYTTALPILNAYGMKATFYIEVENIGRTDTPVPHMSAANLRQMIDDGHEICVHFEASTYLSSTDQQIYDAAKADITFLRDVLTGYKTINPIGGSVTTVGVDTYPEYRNYEIRSCSYRGGVRNNRIDRVLRTLFVSIRSIPGLISNVGNYARSIREDYEHRQLISADSIDTSGLNFDRVLIKVRGCATGIDKPVFYVHSVAPDGTNQGTYAAPSILESEFEELIKTAYRYGIQFTTIGSVNSGGIFGRNNFQTASPFTTLVTGSGNTVTYDTTTKWLTDLPFSIKIDAATAVESNNFGVQLGDFTVEPWCRYIIEIVYKIDTDFGSRAGANEGFNIVLDTFLENANSVQTGSDSLHEKLLNTDHPLNSIGLPYQSTSGGWSSFRTILHSTNGSYANLVACLRSVTGTVYIGGIFVEKGISLLRTPLGGKASFNASAGRRVVLPQLSEVLDALSGTGSVTAGTTALTGSGTKFTELFIGDILKIGSQYIAIASITSDTALTLAANHTAGASGATVYRLNENGKQAGWKVEFVPDAITYAFTFQYFINGTSAAVITSAINGERYIDGLGNHYLRTAGVWNLVGTISANSFFKVTKRADGTTGPTRYFFVRQIFTNRDDFINLYSADAGVTKNMLVKEFYSNNLSPIVHYISELAGDKIRGGRITCFDEFEALTSNFRWVAYPFQYAIQ